MLNKTCCICLQRIFEPFLETKSMEEVQEIVAKIFKIEVEIEQESYSICHLCTERLEISLVLYQKIIDSQKFLKEQELEKVKVEEIEIKDEIELEEPIVEETKIHKEAKTDTQIEEEDQKLLEFYKFTCSECYERFPRFSLYKNHMTQKHAVRLPAIVCCNLRLNKRCRLVEHMLFHTNPSNFKCPDCDKQFKDRHRMIKHRAYHQSREKFKHQCDKCSKRFAGLTNLRAHLGTHLSKAEKDAMKTYICNECGSGFRMKCALTQHMRKIHLKLSDFICDICARQFKSKNDFLYHYSSTHGTKALPKVKCHLCESFLLNEKCLKSHISRIHKHGGPHICKICGKIAPSSQALRSHQLFVHEKERKFKCSHCDKAFKREVSLKEHLTTHVGGALYTCQFCDKTFNSGANMYSHRKRSHPVEHERLIQEKLNEKRPNNNRDEI